MKKLFFIAAIITCFIDPALAQTFTNTLPTTGNIGIGTTSPTNALTLDAASATGLAVYNTASETSNYERFVAQFQNNMFTIGNYFSGTGVARSIQFGIQTSAGGTSLTGGRVFTINPYIGTTVGDFDFNAAVSGSGNIVTMNASLNGSSGQQNILSLQNTVAQSGSTGFTEFLIAPFESTVGTGRHLLIDAGTNSVANDGGTHTQVYTLDDKGNGYYAGTMGLGTTYIPSGFQLAVNGSVIATAVNIQLRSSWPDYVFNKNYHLRSLSYLKEYISDNKHLPGFPSANEIKNNGIDLGQINTLLTKKVEELTLYLIDKDSQIKTDESRIKADEDKLNAQDERISKLESEVQALLKKGN